MFVLLLFSLWLLLLFLSVFLRERCLQTPRVVPLRCVSFLICLPGMVNLAVVSAALANVMNDKPSTMCQSAALDSISSALGPNQLYMARILHWSGPCMGVYQNNALEEFLSFFYIVNWLFYIWVASTPICVSVFKLLMKWIFLANIYIFLLLFFTFFFLFWPWCCDWRMRLWWMSSQMLGTWKVP